MSEINDLRNSSQNGAESITTIGSVVGSSPNSDSILGFLITLMFTSPDWTLLREVANTSIAESFVRPSHPLQDFALPIRQVCTLGPSKLL